MKRLVYVIPLNDLTKTKLNSYGIDAKKYSQFLNDINNKSFDNDNMSEIESLLTNKYQLDTTNIVDFKTFTQNNNWIKRVYYEEVNDKLETCYKFIPDIGKVKSILTDDNKSLDDIKKALKEMESIKGNPKFEEFILNEISSIYFDRQNENGNSAPTEIIKNIKNLDNMELRRFINNPIKKTS